MDDDSDDLYKVAASYIRVKGPEATSHLLEQAQLAEAAGDLEAGETWRDLAEAAADLLSKRKH